MKTVTVSVTKIAPKYLFLLRWMVKLIGATIVVCRRTKKEKWNTAVTVGDGVNESSTDAPCPVTHT